MPPLDEVHEKAVELRELLGNLNDARQYGAGSCVEAAWDGMDAIVELLEFAQCGLREPPRLGGKP